MKNLRNILLVCFLGVFTSCMGPSHTATSTGGELTKRKGGRSHERTRIPGKQIR